MPKYHYPWWGYIKAVIRAYPLRVGKELSGVAAREQGAVQAAIDATERMENSRARMNIIQLVHFKRTHTIKGAALTVSCGPATAARWQRKFFEEVAKNRDLLD